VLSLNVPQKKRQAVRSQRETATKLDNFFPSYRRLIINPSQAHSRESGERAASQRTCKGAAATSAADRGGGGMHNTGKQ